MKGSYFIDIDNKTYISIWNEVIDNTEYDLLINKNDVNDIVIGSITGDTLIIENNSGTLKRVIFQMIKNIRFFME